MSRRKELSRHKKRSDTYQHLYPRISSRKKHIRLIPLPDDFGMLPYHITRQLQRNAGIVEPLYASTKFCKNMYVGCDNPLCAFSHSDATARWTPEYAMDEVFFKHPSDSLRVGMHARSAVPIHGRTFGKPFIVRIPKEDESSSDEEPVSMSLTQLVDEQRRWLRRKHQLAHDRRMKKLLQRYKEEMGPKDMEHSDEEDMEISDDEKDDS